MKDTLRALLLIGTIGLFSSIPQEIQAQEKARIWTVPGRPGVSAVMVSHTSDHVILRTQDGKEHKVQLSRLSQPDQVYVKNGSSSLPSPPASDNRTNPGEFGELRIPLTPEQSALLKSKLNESIKTKSWKPYQDLTESALHQLANKLQPKLGVSTYQKVLSDSSIHTLLTHNRFLKHVPADSLFELPEAESFIDWLFSKPSAMEAFTVSLDPKDDVTSAFEIWQKCWFSVPETQTKYPNLAIACSLVFDKKKTVKTTISGPKPTIDPVQRCQNYVNAANSNGLQTRLEEMPVHELVWVVCANVTSEDLDWARKKVNLSQKSMGRAYPMISYLMERATDNTNPYETYKLEEIKEVGGVCRDQAHFAVNVARAHGVPAYVVSGDGDRGPHAWMGYKMSRNEWNSKTGRYPGYRTGNSRCPQTNQNVREQLFSLWDESSFNNPTLFSATYRFIWMSEIYGEMKNPSAEVALAKMASEIAPHNPDGLDRRIEALEAMPGTTEANWKEVIAHIRRSYRNHPDLLVRGAELESKFISIDENYDELVQSIDSERRNILRKDKERSDLLVLLYKREASLAIHKKDFDAVLAIYKGAFKTLSGDVPAFKQLARDLVDSMAKADSQTYRRDAINTIERALKNDIETGSSEYFRQQSEASARKLFEKLKASI